MNGFYMKCNTGLKCIKYRIPTFFFFLFSFQNFIYTIQKSHTCEEGGAHTRIFVWHLLMNLKNNYLLKKPLKWANKKCKYFNIYKNKKKNKK